ncbi:HIRAN domain-containing protein [Gordonia malaquae]|uniref:HIRAN domain-containing protein n=1 Tax=Gordonia malaquae TaxID=410332 RepID=UPI0030FF0BE2
MRRQHAIERLFPPTWNRDGEELRTDVELVPEPDNEHDPNAIAVHVDGTPVGYVPAEVAPLWVRTIRRISDSDCTAITSGRIYLYERDDWSDWSASRPTKKTSIRFDILLPENPDDAIPLNDPPEMPHTMLPKGGIVQVTKEADYFDTLFEHVPESGYGLLYATLHRGVVTTARSSRAVVAVHIDGAKIGELTPAMSAKFLPMIDHLDTRGLVPACWADITGSSVAAEVRIDAVKAHEISDDTLDGAPTVIPNLLPEVVTTWWYDVTTPRQHRNTGIPVGR